MTVEVDETTGVWITREAGGCSPAFALRQELLERLVKADGHINAAERRLWHETERGLWSARQAMARVAEVWLVLSGELAELPPVERYLKKDVMHARLQAAAAMPKQSVLESLWQDAMVAEDAILAAPFLMLSTPLSDPDRAALDDGLGRQDRYIKALRGLVHVTESAFAEHFIALRPGNWLRLEDTASTEIADPLIKSMRHVELLSGWRGGQRIADSDSGGLLQLAVVLEVTEQALTRLEELVAPKVDLGVGGPVLLYDSVPARITKRGGVHLMLDLGQDATREARLFHDYLQIVAGAHDKAGRERDHQKSGVNRPTVSDMEAAIADWEEAVSWIEKGWDCIEEYQFDVGCREALDDLVERFDGEPALADELLLRLQQADERFRAVTKEARISILDCGPKFQYIDEEYIRFLPLNEYDPQRHWYFYRWQPDCPYSLEGHDAYSYQKQQYGLDFLNMTEEQLLDAVRREVARWKEWSGR